MSAEQLLKSDYAPPTVFDRMVGWFDPRRGLLRHGARQLLVRAYEAANPRDPWRPRRGGASANADHMADARLVRTKARSLVQNVPYIAAAIGSLVQNVIGTGIVPVWESEEATKLWKEWVPVADADGLGDFYALQARAYRAMEVDGEVLVRYRWRRAEDGLPVPLQLQLLEIDWLDTSRIKGSDGGNTIVNGIEYDALGRKVAFWLWDQHPGDVTLRKGTRTESRRVEARLITHLFRADRPGQGRGFSRLAPVISGARDLRLLQDAELARKNLETRLGVLASGDVSLMALQPSQLTPDQSKKSGELGQLPSGGIVNMPPGVNITTVAPHVAPGFTDYVKLELHLQLAGIGVPYEDGTGDMREVNFSSSRVKQSTYRRMCEQIQWLDLVPNLCNPIADNFVAAARMVSKLRGSAVLPRDWSTPRWEYTNPQQDVNASVTEIGAGMQSVSEHIRRRGYEPEKVFTELGSDIKRLKEIGVFDALMFILKGHSPSNGEGDAPSTSPKKD